MTPRQIATRILTPAIIIVATAGFLLLYLPGMRPERAQVSTVTGTAAIGGAFTLVDQHNVTVTSDSLKGRYLLVYFGFTNCPDICPVSLQTMTQALEIDGPIVDNVVPIFISVDPERDTPKAMADYIANFHPRFLALSGTLDQVRAAAAAYRVFFQKAKETAPGDYMMEHSGFVYLMDPDGRYVTHFRSDTTAEQMAARLRLELGPKR